MDDATTTTGTVVGAGGGGLAGAGTGAVIGTVICPGVGTLIGAGVGALAGGTAGGALGKVTGKAVVGARKMVTKAMGKESKKNAHANGPSAPLIADVAYEEPNPCQNQTPYPNQPQIMYHAPQRPPPPLPDPDQRNI